MRDEASRALTEKLAALNKTANPKLKLPLGGGKRAGKKYEALGEWVIEFHENDGIRMSKVDFGGITREACLEYLPEVEIGD